MLNISEASKVRIIKGRAIFIWSRKLPWGFPCGAVVKNPPSNARDTDLIPGPGRFHMLSPCATTTEPAHSRAHAPQQEKPELHSQDPAQRRSSKNSAKQSPAFSGIPGSRYVIRCSPLPCWCSHTCFRALFSHTLLCLERIPPFLLPKLF
mgnify:CR=1 FL=1